MLRELQLCPLLLPQQLQHPVGASLVGLAAPSYLVQRRAAASTSRAQAWARLQGTFTWCWIPGATSFGSSALRVRSATLNLTRFSTHVSPDLSLGSPVGPLCATGLIHRAAILKSRHACTKYPTVTDLSLLVISPLKR